jgi:hypothetical protein
VTDPQTASQAPWWWSSVYTSVIAVLSAVIVAVLSYRLNSKRERERMVEDRLFRETVDWYFRITRTLVELMFVYAQMEIAKHPARQPEFEAQKLELTRRLTVETIESHCFVPVETIHVLQVLQSNLSQLGTQPTLNVVRVRQEMQLAHFALAQFMRKELGLEVLPAGGTAIKTQAKPPQ